MPRRTREEFRASYKKRGGFQRVYFEEELSALSVEQMVDIYRDPETLIMGDSLFYDDDFDDRRRARMERTACWNAAMGRMVDLGRGLEVNFAMLRSNPRLFGRWKQWRRRRREPVLLAPLEPEAQAKALEKAHRMNEHDEATVTAPPSEGFLLGFRMPTGPPPPSASQIREGEVLQRYAWQFDPSTQEILEKMRSLTVEQRIDILGVEGPNLELPPLEEGADDTFAKPGSTVAEVAAARAESTFYGESTQKQVAPKEEEKRLKRPAGSAAGKTPDEGFIDMAKTRQSLQKMADQLKAKAEPGTSMAGSDVSKIIHELPESGSGSSGSVTQLEVQAQVAVPRPEAERTPTSAAWAKMAETPDVEMRRSRGRGKAPRSESGVPLPPPYPPGSLKKSAAKSVAEPRKEEMETDTAVVKQEEDVVDMQITAEDRRIVEGPSDDEEDFMNMTPRSRRWPKKKRKSRSRSGSRTSPPRYGDEPTTPPRTTKRDKDHKERSSMEGASTRPRKRGDAVELAMKSDKIKEREASLKIKCPDADKGRIMWPAGFRGYDPISECQEEFCLARSAPCHYMDMEIVVDPFFAMRPAEDAIKFSKMREGPYDMRWNVAPRLITFGKEDRWDDVESRLEKQHFFDYIHEYGEFTIDLEGFGRATANRLGIQSQDAFSIMTIGSPNGYVLAIQVNFDGEKVLGVQVPRPVLNLLQSPNLRRSMFGGYDDFCQMGRTGLFGKDLEPTVDLCNLVIIAFPQHEKADFKHLKSSKNFVASEMGAPVRYERPNEKLPAAPQHVKVIMERHQDWDFAKPFGDWTLDERRYTCYDHLVAHAFLDGMAARLVRLDTGAWKADVVRIRHFLLAWTWGFGSRIGALELYPHQVRPYGDTDWWRSVDRGEQEKAMPLWERGKVLHPYNPFTAHDSVTKQLTWTQRKYQVDAKYLPAKLLMKYEVQAVGRFDPAPVMDENDPRYRFGLIMAENCVEWWLDRTERDHHYPHFCGRCGSFEHMVEGCVETGECLVSWCKARKGAHITGTCPELVKFCERCGEQGHDATAHDSFSTVRLREEFRIARYFHFQAVRLLDDSKAYQYKRRDGQWRVYALEFSREMKAEFDRMDLDPRWEAARKGQHRPAPDEHVDEKRHE